MAWQPTWQVLVAFNNNAQDDPANITTVASPPGALGAANVWTDITADVRDAVDTNRGRQHETDRVQAGTLALTLDNRAGKYDPWSTTSPYAGKVLPGKPLRLQATFAGTTHNVYTGITDVWATQWTAPSYTTVALSCVDQFAYLSNAYLPANFYEINVAADSPAVWWTLGDPTGSAVAADLSGHNHPGHYWGAVTLGQPGPNPIETGTAAQFTNNTQHVNLPNALAATGDTTLEAWIKTSGSPIANYFIYTQQDQSGYGPGGIGPALALNSSGNVVLYGIYNLPPAVGTHSFNDGNWHHIVGVSTAAGVLTIYVDNVIEQQGTAGTGTTQNANTTLSFVGFYPTVQTDLNITVAHVTGYNSALTATQVANHYNAGIAVPVETSWNRVQRIGHTWMGAPVPSLIPLDQGSSQMQAITAPLGSTSALSYLQTVEQSEAGLLYVDVTGHLQFAGRVTVYTNTTSTVTFGDNPGEYPFELNPQIATDTQDVYGYVQIQRNNGNPQTATVPNANTFGTKTLQISGLLNTTDTEIANMANWYAVQFANPRPRIRQITIRPVTDPTGATTTALLGLDIGSVVTVNRHHVPGGGTAFSQVSNVEGVNYHIDPATGDWNVELQLTPIAPVRPWILGTSQLGVDTALFF
jgi:hypothetical protein